MGANAQTSVPDFTAGQVLTAQQQTEINTGIPVFATSVERDAAFGGTGEKTLAEGQFAFLEDTDTTQFYDGSTWQTVGGGLVKIAGTTSFSAVSSFTLPTSTFTSAYKNYLLLVQCESSASGNNIIFQVRSGGTTATASYYGSVNRLLFTGSASDLLTNNASSLTLAVSATPVMNFQLNLGGGFGQTGYSNITGFSVSNSGNGSATIGGSHAVAQNNDSAVFSVSAGTITGNYEVYGYSL